MTHGIVRCLIIFLSLLSVGWVNSDTTTVKSVSDGEIIVANLRGYNASKAYTQKITIDPNSDITIKIIEIPLDTSFIIVQVHTYQYNVTLSYDNAHLNKVSNESIFGTNLGLYIKPDSNSAGPVYVRNRNVHTVHALVAIVSYGANAPIPGGCNMEFEIEVAPYQKLVAGNAMITVDAQLASLPTIKGAEQPPCEKQHLNHDMYHMYLERHTFSPELYFSSIEQMLTVDGIIKNARQVPRAVTASALRRVYSAYIGVGSVYGVVATYGNYSSAYVPTFTYACSPLLYPDSCSMMTEFVPKVFVGIIAMVAFISLFHACDILRIDLILPTCVTGGILGYTLSYGIGDFSPTINTLVGVLFAVIASLIWIYFWKQGSPVHVLFSSLSLGFLFACIIFFYSGAPVIWENDWLFSIIFVTVILFTSFITSGMLHFGEVLAATIFAAYIIVLVIDYLAGSSLKYIVINMIRRFTVPGFNTAVIDPPIHSTEHILGVFWIIALLSRFFKVFCRSKCCRRRTDPDENTPLFA